MTPVSIFVSKIFKVRSLIPDPRVSIHICIWASSKSYHSYLESYNYIHPKKNDSYLCYKFHFYKWISWFKCGCTIQYLFYEILKCKIFSWMRMGTTKNYNINLLLSSFFPFLLAHLFFKSLFIGLRNLLKFLPFWGFLEMSKKQAFD